jgi:hypothetical protein
MNTIAKVVFMFSLLSINLVAAAFMINESAGYYRMLYPATVVLIPWVAAILAELFQHLMMILTDSRGWLTWVFRALAGILFCLTVAGAGYRVLKPIEMAQEQANRQSKLTAIIEQEIADNRTDRHLFVGDGQKTNTAISVNERRKSSQQLKGLLSEPTVQTVSSLSSFEIAQLFFLRIAIQISALACAWKIGSMYRAKNPKRTAKHVLRKWRVKNGEFGFVGIVEFEDKTFLAVTKNERRQYKTFRGALQFFNDTKYAGKIPLEPTEINF